MVVAANIEKYYAAFTRVALNITKGYERDAQDLVQEFYLSTLEYPNPQKLEQVIADGNFIFWGTRIMVNMYIRERGYFKQKYYKEKTGTRTDFADLDHLMEFTYLLENIQDVIEDKMLLEKQYTIIQEKLSELHWYDRKIIEVYYGINTPDGKGYSVRGLSKATGISASSLFHTIKKTKKHLKSE